MAAGRDFSSAGGEDSGSEQSSPLHVQVQMHFLCWDQGCMALPAAHPVVTFSTLHGAG